MHPAHPLGVALGQVVVDGDHVHAVAGERVEVGRQHAGEGLALTGLHLGDVAQVQRRAAHELHPEVPLPQRARGGLADDGERLRQQRVERLAVGVPLLELVGLGPQLRVAQVDVVVRERLDRVGDPGRVVGRSCPRRHGGASRTPRPQRRRRHQSRLSLHPQVPLRNLHRVAHDLDDLGPDLLDFLAERHLATLTTLRADGTPHVVPVGVTYDADARLARVITSGTSAKARNVREGRAPGRGLPGRGTPLGDPGGRRRSSGTTTRPSPRPSAATPSATASRGSTRRGWSSRSPSTASSATPDATAAAFRRPDRLDLTTEVLRTHDWCCVPPRQDDVDAVFRASQDPRVSAGCRIPRPTPGTTPSPTSPGRSRSGPRAAACSR